MFNKGYTVSWKHHATKLTTIAYTSGLKPVNHLLLENIKWLVQIMLIRETRQILVAVLKTMWPGKGQGYGVASMADSPPSMAGPWTHAILYTHTHTHTHDGIIATVHTVSKCNTASSDLARDVDEREREALSHSHVPLNITWLGLRQYGNLKFS